MAAAVLWVLWLVDAMPLFWLGLVALALPAALAVLRRSIGHLLRPPEAAPTEPPVPSLFAVCLERGLRAALLIGAVYFLAWAWDIDRHAHGAADMPGLCGVCWRRRHHPAGRPRLASAQDLIDKLFAKVRDHARTRGGAAPGALAHAFTDLPQHGS